MGTVLQSTCNNYTGLLCSETCCLPSSGKNRLKSWYCMRCKRFGGPNSWRRATIPKIIPYTVNYVPRGSFLVNKKNQNCCYWFKSIKEWLCIQRTFHNKILSNIYEGEIDAAITADNTGLENEALTNEWNTMISKNSVELLDKYRKQLHARKF